MCSWIIQKGAPSLRRREMALGEVSVTSRFRAYLVLATLLVEIFRPVKHQHYAATHAPEVQLRSELLSQKKWHFAIKVWRALPLHIQHLSSDTFLINKFLSQPSAIEKNRAIREIQGLRVVRGRRAKAELKRAWQLISGWTRFNFRVIARSCNLTFGICKKYRSCEAPQVLNGTGRYENSGGTSLFFV